MFETTPDAITVLIGDLGMLLAALVLARLLDPAKMFDRALFGLTAGSLLLSYAAWRWTDTLPPLDMSVESLWAHLFFFFEAIAMTFSLASIVILLRTVDRSKQADAAAQKLADNRYWPPADVFICSYNEPIEVIEKSIVAATAIDYPNFTVWVLDDTRRDWLKTYCAQHGVGYISRPDNAGAKAGNLNHALAYTARVTNGLVILVLDADFAAQPNILRRTVGLLGDPSVAIVQTPQFYYNPDPVQHNLAVAHSWVDDQRFFFDVFQPAKDAWGCAFCVGTSFVVRRDRLNEIGGFPAEAISEDINLTYRLLMRGYRTIWLNERLSVGLSAEGLPEYLTQRSRWCLGTIQVALLKNGPFLAPGLTLTQRLHYLHGVLNWLSKPFLVLMLIAPTLYWFADIPAFHADYVSFLRYGLPALIGLGVYNFWISGARALPFFNEVTETISAFAVSATLLRALVKPFGQPFRVTGKGGDRSQPQVRWSLARIFACVGAASAASIVWSFISPTAASEISPADLFNLVWAGVAMTISFGAFAVCFERPRGDAQFRFAEETQICTRGRISSCAIVSLSTSSAQIRNFGKKLSVDDEILILARDVGWISGRAVAVTPEQTSIKLEPTPEQHRELLLLLFTSRMDNVARTARLFPSMAGLLQRAFRPERTSAR